MKILMYLILIQMIFIAPLVADDFSVVRERVTAELLKSIPSGEELHDILDKMNEDGSFQGIDYLDLSRTAGFPHRHHTAALVSLAKAYRNKGTLFSQSKEIRDHIIKSLQFWVDHDFFGDNWHDNQISTPTNLVHLMLLIGQDLPKDLVEKTQPIIGRAHMNASGARPSGDRIVIAGILAKNLLFVGDRNQFDDIIRLIENEVKFSTGQRGMQHDYSFHHRVDRVNNTTSYGYGKYANVFGEWCYYVANTRYAFSLEKINHLVDYYLDGIYKQLVYGIYEDISVKNRSITNQTEFRPKDIIEIERLLFSTTYRKNELEEILRLRKGEIKPTAAFAKFFWQTEHFVFQRPGFYTTVRMYSTRNRNMEEPYNGPGKTTHHRADGTNYLQLKGDEYHDIWPVYDWQKISGTTVAQKEKLHGIENIQLDGLTDFVGAVTDGLYGAVGFDFKSPHDLVNAKKSWFFFDEEYVCLGAGISLKNDLPVFTTIDQVLMRGDVSVIQDQRIFKLPAGDHDLKNVSGVYHGKVGYLFPELSNIHISNHIQQGSWADITDRKNISKDLIQKEVFTAFFDHGHRPQNEKYAYLVIPNKDLDQFLEISQGKPAIEVISNSPEMQAVFHHKLKMGQLIFYESGKITLPGGIDFEMESQGMVMVQIEDGKIRKMCVSDPSRKLNKLMLSISGTYPVQGTNYKGLVSDHSTTLIVELPAGVYKGKSVEILL